MGGSVKVKLGLGYKGLLFSTGRDGKIRYQTPCPFNNDASLVL